MMAARFCAVLLVCFALLADQARAQQNLFNIPSGDITENGKWFYQHQINAYSAKFESKAHLVRGLGRGWDVGVNLVGKGAYFEPEWKPLYNDNGAMGALFPLLMLTAQKQWKLTEHVLFNAGTQVGFNLSEDFSKKKLAQFHYAQTSLVLFDHRLKLVGGGYRTNREFVGSGNYAGVLAGYELKLNKKWLLMGDWISGAHDAGMAVLGMVYNASKRAQLCAGWSLPNRNSSRPQGLVMELNLFGWDMH
jgi:hypothetical protein